MELRVHISNVDNNPAMCFDTGLDPRSFARTKMSQSLIEAGYVVRADGTHDVWKASGVNEIDGSMRVYGPLFQGKRLDLLLNEISSESLGNRDKSALKKEVTNAIVAWIKAKMFLGETRSALNPAASFASPDGSVFFAPEYLSNRCLYLEGILQDTYNCPDLLGMNASAFCAGLMLYKVFANAHPYSGAEIYQDMREGVFLPVNLAVPELNNELAGLIQAALYLPVEKKQASQKNNVIRSGIDILTKLLEFFTGNEPLTADLSKEKAEQIEKERNGFITRQNIIVKTRRFAVSNKYLLIGISVGLLFVLFLVFSTIKTISLRSTTQGMTSENVVGFYYDAFSSLNHELMEACVQNAGKADIIAALNLLAVYKQRQAYEMAPKLAVTQAKIWRASGGELPAPDVFGVTDLTIEYVGGDENEGLIFYRVNYNLWSPSDDFVRVRSDRLMLKRDRRNNWRIVEIERTEK